MDYASFVGIIRTEDTCIPVPDSPGLEFQSLGLGIQEKSD